MGDNSNNRLIGVGTVEINEGFVGFVFVFEINGFCKTCEIPVLIKGKCFTNINCGIFGVFLFVEALPPQQFHDYQILVLQLCYRLKTYS